MRIVTVIPSATEIVCALGLRAQLVGVSHECDYPPDVIDLPRVTKTRIDHHTPSGQIDGQVRQELAQLNALYSLNTELLESLAPDLIVTQSLCDVCAVADAEVQAFANAVTYVPEVVNIEPLTLNDVMDTVNAIGAATSTPIEAEHLLSTMGTRIRAIGARTARDITERDKRRVAFLEWVDPPFCGGHWNPELVTLAGGIDCFDNAGQASATVTFDDIAGADPDVLFIACCGFTLERSLAEIAPILAQPQWQTLRAVRERQIFVVDGNAYFSRPGPRLADSAEIIAHALYPALHPAGPSLAVVPDIPVSGL